MWSCCYAWLRENLSAEIRYRKRSSSESVTLPSLKLVRDVNKISFVLEFWCLMRVVTVNKCTRGSSDYMKNHSDLNSTLAISLAETAAGDEQAFKTVYALTAPKLNSIIKGMIKDEALTHDILQQAYVSIWRNAGKFDVEKGKAFTWILVITRRKALDMIRSRRRLSVSEELCENLVDEHMQSDIRAKALLLRRIFEPHLAKLSP